jgi:hypothetical protein
MEREGQKDLKVQNGSKKKTGQKKKSQRGHGCLSVVSVVRCQVEVSATGWSLVQRSPTDCGVLTSVILKPRNEEAQASEKGLLSHRKEKVLWLWVTMKIAVFLDVTSYVSVDRYQRVRGTW